MPEPTQRTALPLVDAAEHLGISPNALRMRVARGRAEGIRREGRLFVYVDAEPRPTIEPAEERTEEPAVEDFNTLLELQRTELNRLLAENRRLNERLDSLLDMLRAEQTGRQALQNLLGDIARSQPTAPPPGGDPRHRLRALEQANRDLRLAVLQMAESFGRGTRSAAQSETDRPPRHLESDTAATRLTLAELSRYLQGMRRRSQT